MQDIVPIKKKPLRDQIMDIINKDESTFMNDILKTLRQCTSHLQKTIQVEDIIIESGLSYAQFITNENLELYFDLVRISDTKDVGYIAKGWDDPGFRIGNVIDLEDTKESEFKEYIRLVYPECTSRGILMNVKEEENGFAMQLEGLIYSEGFNKDTFSQTLKVT